MGVRTVSAELDRIHFDLNGKGKSQVAGIETSNHPVESVTWFEAVDFCNRLSKLDKMKPFYRVNDDQVSAIGGNGYRLPTEAEREYAERGPDGNKYPWGNEEPSYHGSDDNDGG